MRARQLLRRWHECYGFRGHFHIHGVDLLTHGGSSDQTFSRDDGGLFDAISVVMKGGLGGTWTASNGAVVNMAANQTGTFGSAFQDITYLELTATSNQYIYDFTWG